MADDGVERSWFDRLVELRAMPAACLEHGGPAGGWPGRPCEIVGPTRPLPFRWEPEPLIGSSAWARDLARRMLGDDAVAFPFDPRAIARVKDV